MLTWHARWFDSQKGLFHKSIWEGAARNGLEKGRRFQKNWRWLDEPSVCNRVSQANVAGELYQLCRLHNQTLNEAHREKKMSSMLTSSGATIVYKLAFASCCHQIWTTLPSISSKDADWLFLDWPHMCSLKPGKMYVQDYTHDLANPAASEGNNEHYMSSYLCLRGC